MIKKVIQIAASSVIAGGAALAVSVYPSFFLNATEFGYFSQFYVTIGFCVLIFGMGTNVAFSYIAANSLADANKVSKLLNIIDLNAVILLLITFLMFFILQFEVIYLFGAITGALTVRLVNYSGFFLGTGEYFKHNVTAVIRFLPTLVILLLLAPFLDSAVDFALLFIGGALVNYLACKYYCLNNSNRPYTQSSVEYKFINLIKYGSWSLFSTGAYMISMRGFVFLLSGTVSKSASGIFFLYLAVLEAVLIIPAALGKFYFSKYGNGNNIGRKDFIRVALLIVIFSFSIVAITYLVISTIKVSEGRDWPHFEALKLLSQSLLLLIFTGYLKVITQINCARGRISNTFYGSLLSAIVTLSLGYYFIIIYGLIGVVYSLTVGSCLNLLVNFIPYFRFNRALSK